LLVIKVEAFRAGHSSLEMLLRQPRPGRVEQVDLRWKDGIDDKLLLKISYQEYQEIWNRIFFVARYRAVPYPYALRVGAGQRLDRCSKLAPTVDLIKVCKEA
jgi:hypothetical protein